jgi:cardiolipin synthase (CMP-forming)
VIFTLPNLVSFVRVLLVPVFIWLVLAREDFSNAAFLLGFIGATDWVDGYLARRLDQVSAVGKVLDPLADRLAVAAAVIVGWISGALPWPIAALLVAREGVVSGGALLIAITRKGRLEVRRLGKVATFGLYFAIPAFYLAKGSGIAFWDWFAWLVVLPSLILYYVVAAQYAGDVRRLLAHKGQ